MSQIDPVVRKETGFVALWVAVAILPVQLAFWLCGIWGWPVLWGSLLGSATAIGNTLLVGLMVQKAVTQTEKQAKTTVRLSQSGRLMIMGLVLVLAAVLPKVFSIWTTVIPLLIPRVAVSARGYIEVKRNPHPDRPAIGWEDEDDEEED